MDIQAKPPKDNLRSAYRSLRYWMASLLPFLGFVLWDLITNDRLSLQILILPIFISFTFNFFLPYAITIRRALYLSIPPLLLFICFFVYALIRDSNSPPSTDPMNSLFLVTLCILGPYTFLPSLLLSVVAGWLGARLSKYRFHRWIVIGVVLVACAVIGYFIYIAIQSASATSQLTKNLPTKPASESTLDSDLIIGQWNCPFEAGDLEIQKSSSGEGYTVRALSESSEDFISDIIMEFSYDRITSSYLGRHIWGGRKSTWEWGDFGGVSINLIDKNTLYLQYLDSINKDGWPCTRVNQ